MIEIQQSDDTNDPETRIILSPDRSLSWQGNKRVIWILSLVCGGIAVGFTIIAGTWVMLPFAGLEILSLTTALYYVSWKLSYRHIISLTKTTITLEKGVYRPRGKWVWQKQDTQLATSPSNHDWEAPSMQLICDRERISLGDFLGRDDAEQLIAYLKNEILVTRAK